MKYYLMIFKKPLYRLNFISVRSFTLSSVFSNKSARLNPESVANAHINSNKATDHLIINKILYKYLNIFTIAYFNNILVYTNNILKKYI